MYRKNVAHKREQVLRFREECDAYTGSTTCENVDHVIEMQISHYAATHIIDKHAGLAKCFAEVVNDVDNLNVTSRRINQSKKGPFTAALNRLRKHEKADCEELGTKLEEQRMTRAHAKALSEATDSIRDTLQNIGFFQPIKLPAYTSRPNRDLLTKERTVYEISARSALKFFVNWND